MDGSLVCVTGHALASALPSGLSAYRFSTLLLCQPRGLAAVPGTDLIRFRLRAFRSAWCVLLPLPGTLTPPSAGLALHGERSWVSSQSSSPLTPWPPTMLSCQALPLPDVILYTRLVCSRAGPQALSVRFPERSPGRKQLLAQGRHLANTWGVNEESSKCIVKTHA